MFQCCVAQASLLEARHLATRTAACVTTHSAAASLSSHQQSRSKPPHFIGLDQHQPPSTNGSATPRITSDSSIVQGSVGLGYLGWHDRRASRSGWHSGAVAALSNGGGMGRWPSHSGAPCCPQDSAAGTPLPRCEHRPPLALATPTAAAGGPPPEEDAPTGTGCREQQRPLHHPQQQGHPRCSERCTMPTPLPHTTAAGVSRVSQSGSAVAPRGASQWPTSVGGCGHVPPPSTVRRISTQSHASHLGGVGSAAGELEAASSLKQEVLELSHRVVAGWVARVSRAPLYVAFRLWQGAARFVACRLTALLAPKIVQHKQSP
jgi:hypothetical protein